MKHFFFLSAILLSLSFIPATNSVEDIRRIDVLESMNTFIDLTLSDFANQIDYIPLETNANCLVDQRAHLLNCGEFFLVGEDHQDLMKFDKAGIFLGIFAKYGRGPGEYSLITNLHYDKENQLVILFDGISQRLMYYTLDGSKVKSIDLPIHASDLYHLSGPNFIGEANYQNTLGSRHFSYFLLDTTGKITPLYYEKENLRILDVLLVPNFINGKGNASFLPPFSDTLYQIDQSENIQKTFFDQGKLRLPKKLLYDHAKFRKGFQRYIFPFMIYPGYQDNLFVTFFHKGKPFVGICNLERESLQMINLDNRESRTILNDLDGGLEFIPVSNKFEKSWYKLVWVDELKDLLEEERFLSRKVKYPEKRSQLKKFIENLDDEDNPIIVVVRGR